MSVECKAGSQSNNVAHWDTVNSMMTDLPAVLIDSVVQASGQHHARKQGSRWVNSVLTIKYIFAENNKEDIFIATLALVIYLLFSTLCLYIDIYNNVYCCYLFIHLSCSCAGANVRRSLGTLPPNPILNVIDVKSTPAIHLPIVRSKVMEHVMMWMASNSNKVNHEVFQKVKVSIFQLLHTFSFILSFELFVSHCFLRSRMLNVRVTCHS